MSNLLIWKRSIATVALLLSIPVLVAQNSYKETFKVGNDALVSVNTSHTNVVFETWNKNYVEVEAFIDGEELTEKEKTEIFEDWDIDVLGNSKKVVVTSNSGSLWGGVESIGSLGALEGLEGLKGLYGLSELGNFSFNFEIPDVPDFRDFPNWPFGDEQPGIYSGNGNLNIKINRGRSMNFDTDEYEKDKQGYVNKLNKKYKSNATVMEVDAWLDKVEEWSEDFSEVMEDWGEDFGKEFEDKFGPEFEEKMEKWGEEFGSYMEKWGEEFGEKMEEWGESFGKDMEKWAEQFEDFEGDQVIISPNRNIIINSDKSDLFHEGNTKAKKTIIIRMPKGTKTDINVRHGEVKMADAYNIKANLNYSALSANSIDGGETLINASYAPVMVNNWKQGELDLKFVDNCRINNVTKINLDANSSDVVINNIIDRALLSGSFGNLIINTISNEFKNLNIVLENTDAKISLPKTAFLFSFTGKKSPLLYPKSLQLNNTKSNGKVIVKGFNKYNTSNKKITIDAAYSNVRMQ